MRCSTATGVVYGGIAYACGVPVQTALLAGGMCSAAGMLPDIDSDTSQSFRECIYLAAGVSAVLATMRAQEVLVDSDVISLIGASVFFFVRFVVGKFIQRFTSHRGMFHSIPAAIIAGELAFLVSAGTVEARLIKAGGLVAGFLSHLVLDEMFSISLREMRLLKSFGTALKFGNPKNKQLTAAVYSVMIALGAACLNEPQIAAMLPQVPDGKNNWEGIQQLAQKAQEDLQRVVPESLQPVMRKIGTGISAEIERTVPEEVRTEIASRVASAWPPSNTSAFQETQPPFVAATSPPLSVPAPSVSALFTPSLPDAVAPVPKAPVTVTAEQFSSPNTLLVPPTTVPPLDATLEATLPPDPFPRRLRGPAVLQ